MESTEALNSQTLKALIKESLREVLREERLHLCKLLMPFVSDKEQAEIETQFGSPKDFDVSETVDLTDWVKHGGSTLLSRRGVSIFQTCHEIIN